jgi:hypothetical protein
LPSHHGRRSEKRSARQFRICRCPPGHRRSSVACRCEEINRGSITGCQNRASARPYRHEVAELRHRFGISAAPNRSDQVPAPPRDSVLLRQQFIETLDAAPRSAQLRNRTTFWRHLTEPHRTSCGRL